MIHARYQTRPSEIFLPDWTVAVDASVLADPLEAADGTPHRVSIETLLLVELQRYGQPVAQGPQVPWLFLADGETQRIVLPMPRSRLRGAHLLVRALPCRPELIELRPEQQSALEYDPPAGATWPPP